MTESEGRVHGYEPSSIPSTLVSVARCLSNTRTCLAPFNLTNMGYVSVGLYNPAGKPKRISTHRDTWAMWTFESAHKRALKLEVQVRTTT